MEESQTSRTTTFLTPEGAPALQAQTALLRGAIFYLNPTSHRIRRMRRAEIWTNDSKLQPACIYVHSRM